VPIRIFEKLLIKFERRKDAEEFIKTNLVNMEIEGFHRTFSLPQECSCEMTSSYFNFYLLILNHLAAM